MTGGGKGSSSKTRLGFTENFLISGCSAAISKTSAAPIERVKLLLQNQGELLKQGRLDRSYTGVGDCVKRTLSNEGVLAFWRGNFASVVRYFPQQVARFFFSGIFLCPITFFFWVIFFSGTIFPPAGGMTDEDEVLISMSAVPSSSINC